MEFNYITRNGVALDDFGNEVRDEHGEIIVVPENDRAGYYIGYLRLKIQVFLDGENTWTIDGQTQYFDSFEAAGKELDEHFADMDAASMDYEPTDYRIEVVTQ